MAEPYIEVLTEGASDVPVVRRLLADHFGLVENSNFRIHPHKGKGSLPSNFLARPSITSTGLLDQLPAKLRGFGRSLPTNALVLVLLDLDSGDCKELLKELQNMLASLPLRPPNVLFRIAIEETESWFLADLLAVKAAYPKAKLSSIKSIPPDAVVGAAERLAKAIGVAGAVTGMDKFKWATKIAPFLRFDEPPSPSLGKLVQGTQRYLDHFGQ